MMNLKQAVTQYFPQEIILQEKTVKLTDDWVSPLSKSHFFYVTPIDMIETDKKYYFDRRSSYIKSSQIGSIVSPILVLCMLLLLWITVWKATPQALTIVILIPVMFAVINKLNVKVNQGLTNILTIDKQFIHNIHNEDGKIIIEGEMGSADSYAFPYFMSEKDKQDVGQLDKLFSGLFIKIKKRGSSGMKFTIKYE